MDSLGFESIPYQEFYREMFPSGELATWCSNPREQDETEYKYNGVILEFTDKKRFVPKRDPWSGKTHLVEKSVVKRHMVFDDLKAIDKCNQISREKGNFCMMSPISYCGRNRSTKFERFLYVLTIEVDDLITERIPGKRDNFQKGMSNMLNQWGYNNEPRWTQGLYVPPTAMTCSGNGVHLHWFLKEPYSLCGDDGDYRQMCWDEFRNSFTKYIWNDGVSDGDVQYEYHGQGFRLVGSTSKKGHLVEAFWISKKRYSIEELFNQNDFYIKNWCEPAPLGFYDTTAKKHMDLTKSKDRPLSQRMLECKEIYPEWYQRRIVEKQPPLKKGHWIAHEGLYEWYLDLIKKNVSVGCRFWRIYTLAQYGVKCAIPFERVKDDCLAIGEMFKMVDPEKPLEDWEIHKAMESYFEPKAAESEIDFINRKAWVGIVKNKRNGRPRAEHLERLNKTRKFRRDELGEDEYANSGRPTKKHLVEQWQKENPDGTKKECYEETKISKPTINKWWIE